MHKIVTAPDIIMHLQAITDQITKSNNDVFLVKTNEQFFFTL